MDLLSVIMIVSFTPTRYFIHSFKQSIKDINSNSKAGRDRSGGANLCEKYSHAARVESSWTCVRTAPLPTYDASVSMTVIRSSSKCLRIGVVVRAVFSAEKAFSHWGVQCILAYLGAFLRRSEMGAATICSWGMKIDQKMQDPRKDRTSLAVLGAGRSRMACIFLGATDFPFLSQIMPRNVIDVLNRLHLDNFSLRPALSNLLRSSSRVSRCFSGDLLLIITSSM